VLKLIAGGQDTINLVKKECPSLANVPVDDIALRLRFDGKTQSAVKNVLFIVLPEAWPSAVSDTLPLIHVDVKSPVVDVKPTPIDIKSLSIQPRRLPSTTTSGASKEKTWDDLKREGALLGVEGFTDRMPPKEGARVAAEGSKKPVAGACFNGPFHDLQGLGEPRYWEGA
jgi:hypothetical protein